MGPAAVATMRRAQPDGEIPKLSDEGSMAVVRTGGKRRKQEDGTYQERLEKRNKKQKQTEQENQRLQEVRKQREQKKLDDINSTVLVHNMVELDRMTVPNLKLQWKKWNAVCNDAPKMANKELNRDQRKPALLRCLRYCLETYGGQQ